MADTNRQLLDYASPRTAVTRAWEVAYAVVSMVCSCIVGAIESSFFIGAFDNSGTDGTWAGLALLGMGLAILALILGAVSTAFRPGFLTCLSLTISVIVVVAGMFVHVPRGVMLP